MLHGGWNQYPMNVFRVPLSLYLIDVYISPPDIMYHDTGKNFIKNSLNTNTGMLKIDTNAIQIDSLNYMSSVDRYHDPIGS